MRLAPRLTLPICSLVLCLAGALAPAARGDGDPASDILLYQNAYLPYGQLIPAQLEANVQQVVANAKGANFPVKVAVIASENDLGSVTYMFGQPKQYARFLGKELAAGPSSYRVHAAGALQRGQAAAKLAARSPLLVVMPNGYGVAGPVAANAQSVVERAPVDVNDGISLGQAAVDGVVKLAKAEGHQVEAPPNPLAEPGAPAAAPLPTTPSHHRQGGSTPWAPIGLAAAVVVFLSLAAARWRRRRVRVRSQS
jgi:hypothetical protein